MQQKRYEPYIVPKHGLSGPNATDLTTVGIGVEWSWGEACRKLLRSATSRDYTVEHSCADQVNGSRAVVFDVENPMGGRARILPGLQRGSCGDGENRGDEEGREFEGHGGGGGKEWGKLKLTMLWSATFIHSSLIRASERNAQ